MIRAKNVSLIYQDGINGLKAFDLEINKNQLYYITGPSGSGKTSLLKLFMGIEVPTTGELMVLNKNMTGINGRELSELRKSIGPVFQEFRLIKGRTVMENVLLGMRFLDLSPKEMKLNANEALMRVGLSHKMFNKVEHLSFGETQRVAIARAVARKPKLILADEPTGNLDHDNAVKILELLSSFKSAETTVIITTHATHLMKELKNVHWIQMNKGVLKLERLGE